MTRSRMSVKVEFMAMSARFFAGIVFTLVAMGGSAPAATFQKVDLTYLKPLDIQGQRQSLVTEHGVGAAFVFLSSECPISRSTFRS